MFKFLTTLFSLLIVTVMMGMGAPPGPGDDGPLISPTTMEVADIYAPTPAPSPALVNTFTSSVPLSVTTQHAAREWEGLFCEKGLPGNRDGSDGGLSRICNSPAIYPVYTKSHNNAGTGAGGNPA